MIMFVSGACSTSLMSIEIDYCMSCDNDINASRHSVLNNSVEKGGSGVFEEHGLQISRWSSNCKTLEKPPPMVSRDKVCEVVLKRETLGEFRIRAVLWF